MTKFTAENSAEQNNIRNLSGLKISEMKEKGHLDQAATIELKEKSRAECNAYRLSSNNNLEKKTKEINGSFKR